MDAASLKKIEVVLRKRDGESGTFAKATPFSFIYGTASSGLTPFEAELAKYSVGERFTIAVDQEELAAYFGHLLRPLLQEMKVQVLPRRFGLEVEISEVVDPPQREIVQAMAAAAGGGCGGGCGCGCH